MTGLKLKYHSVIYGGKTFRGKDMRTSRLRLNRVLVADLEEVFEGLDDEDEWDERGEGLFGESSEVPHERAGVGGDQDHADHAGPEPDPNPERDEVDPETPAKTK